MAVYKVKISEEAIDYRTEMLKIIDSVKIVRDSDSLEFIVRCAADDIEAVEYELRKAERRDDYCLWERIS